MGGEANIWNPRTLLDLSADTKRITEKFTATAGQTLFTLNDFTYVVGTGALQVFKNGVHMTPGVDFVEGTTSTLSLTVGTTAGDKIVVVGYAGITGTVDVRDTDIFLLNYQALRDYAGAETTIYIQGTAIAGDGGQAFFQKFTGAAPGTYVDDGLGIIIPTGGDGSIGWTKSNRQFYPTLSGETGVTDNTYPVFTPDRYGTVTYDSATDVSTPLQAAIDAANTYGSGVVNILGPWALSSTVTVKNGVILDFNSHALTQIADVDLIKVNPGGQVRNGRIVATGTYSSVVLELLPTSNTRGAQFRGPWYDNIEIEMDSGTGTGTGIKLNASTYYIQEMQAGHGAVYFGEYGLLLLSGANAETQYCNGNNFNGLMLHDPVNAIYEDISASSDAEAVNGNSYLGVTVEKNSYGAVQFATAATFIGNLWDGPNVTFKGDDNKIFSSIYRILLTTLTDEGRNNHIYAQDAEYHDGVTTSEYNDARSNYLNIQGRLEFRDWFDGANLKPEWRLTGVGTPVGIFQVSTLGGATYKISTNRYRIDTSSSTSDSSRLDWENPHIHTGSDPVMHVTLLLGNTSNVTYQLGFYADSNNYILFESDVATPKWICRVKVGGVETTIDITTGVNFNHLHFLSLLVTNTKITFQQGNISTGNNGVGYGRYNQTNIINITTNIPVNVGMTPYLNVITNTTAAATLFLYDVQIIRKWMTTVG